VNLARSYPLQPLDRSAQESGPVFYPEGVFSKDAFFGSLGKLKKKIGAVA
jgi:hypothetical protein